jgi:DNA-binding LacI/PurR family transcriptional regulator
MRSLHQSGVKLVCADRLPEGLEVDAIASDNFRASLKALYHQVERGITAPHILPSRQCTSLRCMTGAMLIYR